MQVTLEHATIKGGLVQYAYSRCHPVVFWCHCRKGFCFPQDLLLSAVAKVDLSSRKFVPVIRDPLSLTVLALTGLIDSEGHVL